MTIELEITGMRTQPILKVHILTVLILVTALIAPATAFEISPLDPDPGESVSLTGVAGQDEKVTLSSTFEMALPVEGGTYEYVAEGVKIPQKPNRFSVTARGVDDVNVGVKMGIWLTRRVEASGGTASISQSDVPPGRYTLKIFGRPAEGASAVDVQVRAETTVTADSRGRYSLEIDTHGIPEGEYRIVGDGDSKVIMIGGQGPAKITHGSAGSAGSTRSTGSSRGTPTGSSASSQDVDGSTTGAGTKDGRQEITPEVIGWYAAKQGLVGDEGYKEAETQLVRLTKGGAWKVVSRGQNLTEECGRCQEDFCLVRGEGACTTCRIKCELGSSGDAGGTNAASSDSEDPGPGIPDNETAKPVETAGGLMRGIVDVLHSILDHLRWS